MKTGEQKKYLTLTAFLLLAAVLLFSHSAEAIDGECKVDCESLCSTYTDSGQKEDCEKKCKDDEKECEALNEKARNYEQIIRLKNKQQDTIYGQLENINQEQQGNRQELLQVNGEIISLDREVGALREDILEKEKNIAYQKKILTSLMQSYYDYDQQGLLGIVLLNQDLSKSLSQSDYIEQSGVRVSEILDEIQDAHRQLSENRKKIEEDLNETSRLQEELAYKQYNLHLSENQKQNLLIKTQGEEEKYKELLALIGEQKKQLFDFGSFGDYNISDKDRPEDKNKLSNSWYYSQRDSRWGDMKIGVSSLKMKDYGCAISSVAMVYSYYGNKNTPKDILKKSDFDGALIYWPSGWHDTGYGYTNYKNKLDGILKDNDVAIIHLTFSGGGHFVVVGGVVGEKDKKDYIIHDPYFGSNIYLGASLRILNARVDRIIYK